MIQPLVHQLGFLLKRCWEIEYRLVVSEISSGLLSLEIPNETEVGQDSCDRKDIEDQIEVILQLWYNPDKSRVY